MRQITEIIDYNYQLVFLQNQILENIIKILRLIVIFYSKKLFTSVAVTSFTWNYKLILKPGTFYLSVLNCLHLYFVHDFIQSGNICDLLSKDHSFYSEWKFKFK